MTVFRFLWRELIAYRVVSGVLGLLLMYSRSSQTGQHLEFESLRCSFSTHTPAPFYPPNILYRKFVTLIILSLNEALAMHAVLR